MGWAGLGQLPGALLAALSLLLLGRTEGENKVENLLDRDKGREIIHQLLSWAKQTCLREKLI